MTPRSSLLVALVLVVTTAPAPVAGVAVNPYYLRRNGKGDGDKSGGRSYAVYRMLGNDMWPLQGPGQMRRNSVYSAIHEEQAPANIHMYWVINRIVNATERGLLVKELKRAGAKRILYASPPLNAMHCLSSPMARVLFAQAQNSVRNAMLAHAKSRGHSWAITLDGNQFLPKGFYDTMSSVFRQNEYFQRLAVLIPMLRVRELQTPDIYNADATLRSMFVDHFTNRGDFLISEPQLALHVDRLAGRGLSFDERSQYGRSNKAAMVGRLCSRRDRLSLSTRCCEVVRANMRAMTLRARMRGLYTGGEVNLKNRVFDITKRRMNRIKGIDSSTLDETADGKISNTLKLAVLDEAERLARQCGVTFRLFNHPDVSEASSQHRIATNVMVRARFRYKAGKFLRKYIDAYLKHSVKPSREACNTLTRKVTLVDIDPDPTTPEEAQLINEEMEQIKKEILGENESEDEIQAEDKDAEFIAEKTDDEKESDEKEPNETEDTLKAEEAEAEAMAKGGEDARGTDGESKASPPEDEKPEDMEAQAEAELEAEEKAVEVDTAEAEAEEPPTPVKPKRSLNPKPKRIIPAEGGWHAKQIAGAAASLEAIRAMGKSRKSPPVALQAEEEETNDVSNSYIAREANIQQSGWMMVLTGAVSLCLLQAIIMVCCIVVKRLKERRARRKAAAASPRTGGGR